MQQQIALPLGTSVTKCNHRELLMVGVLVAMQCFGFELLCLLTLCCQYLQFFNITILCGHYPVYPVCFHFYNAA